MASRPRAELGCRGIIQTRKQGEHRHEFASRSNVQRFATTRDGSASRRFCLHITSQSSPSGTICVHRRSSAVEIFLLPGSPREMQPPMNADEFAGFRSAASSITCSFQFNCSRTDSLRPGPGSISFASSAAMIQRHVVIAGKRREVSSSGAFPERPLAITFEHQPRHPVKCRSRVPRRKCRPVVVDKALS